MLMCASSLHSGPMDVCTPDSFSLSGVKHKCQPIDLTSLLEFSHSEVPPLWDFRYSESPLCCWIFPTQSPTKFSTPLLWRPDPTGTGTPLQRIYAGRKYPRVYTLSFSTGKNQRRKHSGNIHSNRIVRVHGYHRKWYNITGILHHKSTIHEGIYIIKTERCSRYDKWDLGSQTGENLERRTTAVSELLLHSDHHERICCALWSVTARSTRSRLQDLDMRIQGCYQPQRVQIIKPSGVHNRHTCTWSSDVVQACRYRKWQVI